MQSGVPDTKVGNINADRQTVTIPDSQRKYKMKGVDTMKRCPKCGRPIYGEPALSRTDNETEICSECGTLEAIETYLGYISGERFIKEHDYEDDEEVMI